MKNIEILEENIFDELEDAEKYAMLAIKNKDNHLGKLFHELSIEEMVHMERLHQAVISIIDKYKKETGDPPAAMLAVYNYLHDQHIKKSAHIRATQAMFNQM